MTATNHPAERTTNSAGSANHAHTTPEGVTSPGGPVPSQAERVAGSAGSGGDARAAVEQPTVSGGGRDGVTSESSGGAEAAGRRSWLRWGALVLTVVLVGALGYLWYDSRVPSTLSVMEMGYADWGGGAVPAAGHQHAGGISITGLTGPSGPPAVAVSLTARAESFTLATGERVAGYTLNHSSPGPEIRARVGDLVQVELVNESVPDGVALHWHGVRVPNAEDGVAGVTQDAVPIGGRHTYRFVVHDPGTYWYHSHQVSHEQVKGGLFGALVVEPATADAGPDVVAQVHTYDGRRTVQGATGERSVSAPAGVATRVRVVNTDNGPLRVSVTGAPYRVVAVDGHDLHGPSDVTDRGVSVAAGGRVDLLVTPPAGGAVRVDLGAGSALVVGPPGASAPAAVTPAAMLDLLSYGTPAPVSLGAGSPGAGSLGPVTLDTGHFDRSFELTIDRRPGFLDGRPGLWWTMNGHLYPDVPMFMVRAGDIVRMTITNNSGEVHPMHLHGHVALVLSRDGVAGTGSPWWTDSLDVAEGESYVIAFRADNPGIWMDHCHNLPHATDGMVAHLAYEGYTTPYLIGGTAKNEPE
ncbi:Multicopper oxidase with three cupredoxin domains (includes cell division protein FtsP and spore coat protein CotA) [Asanoa hainanensis]|uniref:Multicopper oxidase with three cupredoxin domains (Includes cell division protein FtsP and spore coat protein CotA) n=1 Tax=Asanoa hainanensis TaxID=560556 RepID=A0A239LA07_9ACTN|nr:multicopper oxidase family protein [Asanoa hainanensis]SNT27291.1 Multicopper oxidase with three cupredoxin domains (includes cell division protein FtsP and spore coat protein CotA) [Asanoa hainanensis]